MSLGVFLLLYFFWGDSEKDWYPFFFKCLVKVTSAAIWFRAFFLVEDFDD